MWYNRVKERYALYVNKFKHIGKRFNMNINFNAIVRDVLNEFDTRNVAYCDNEKAEYSGNDRAIDLTWDRYERHDDKINALIHVLRYGMGIDVSYKSNGYGYVTSVTFKSDDINETYDIHLQGFITRWIESEKKRIEEKYFTIVK